MDEYQQGVPMSDSQGGFSQTISALIENDINQDAVEQFMAIILGAKDIPLSKLTTKDVAYFENTIRYIKGLYISGNDISDEEYNKLEVLEIACIARIKRGHDGFERKTLQKQIRESVTSTNEDSSSFLSKLFGRGGNKRK